MDNVQKYNSFNEAHCSALSSSLQLFPRFDDKSIFSHIQNGSEAHPVSYPTGNGSLSPRVKRQDREADHSLPFSAEDKNALSYTSTHPIRLHSLVLN
jgi:hypothetical protein